MFIHNLSRLTQSNKKKVLMFLAFCWINAVSSVKPKSSNLDHGFNVISTGKIALPFSPSSNDRQLNLFFNSV